MKVTSITIRADKDHVFLTLKIPQGEFRGTLQNIINSMRDEAPIPQKEKISDRFINPPKPTWKKLKNAKNK